MSRLLYFIICLSLVQGAFAQVRIEGEIRSAQGGEAVAGANLMLHPKNKLGTILAFGFTDSKGRFGIDVQPSGDSLTLLVKSMAFRDTLMHIAAVSQRLRFALAPQQFQLEEVTVRGRPISWRGDTTTYLVGQFAKPKDISIGDVIARLPGFEVSQEGQINYQGKPIQKYYIEGSDLLEGRYAIANKNLPHTAVGSVEVMENHQPVRMLQGVLPSNETSLNIKLKNNVAVTGTARVGAGFEPFLYDANLTPMLFNARHQVIGSLQANNVGNDLWEQFAEPMLTGGGATISFTNLYGSAPKLVGVSSINKPDIAKQRYLFNRAFFGSYNHLIKLSSTSDIKLTVNYLNDRIGERASSSTSYIMPDSTLTLSEQMQNRYMKNNLSCAAAYQQNSEGAFVKEKISFNVYNDREIGTTSGLDGGMQQEAATPSIAVKNTLEATFRIGKRKKFVGASSSTNFSNLPQWLSIAPGVFPALLNGGLPYSLTTQRMEGRSFDTDNSLKFSNSHGRWSIGTEVRGKFESQHRQSAIEVDGVALLADSLRNSLRWNCLDLSVREKIAYNGLRLKMSVALPLSYQRYGFSDKHHPTPANFGDVLLNPSFYLNWQICGFWSSNLSMSYTSRYSNPTSLTQGYVVSSYRSIGRNTSHLGSSSSISGNIHLQYKNPIAGFFISADIMRHITIGSHITTRELQPNGTVVSRAVRHKNTSTMDFATSSISWFLSDYHTTLSIKGEYTHHNGSYIFNGKLSESDAYTYRISPTVGFSRWRWLGIDYMYSWNLVQQQAHGVKSKMLEQKHRCGIYIYPSNQHIIGADVELYQTDFGGNQQRRDIFANISYSFKPKNIPLQFQLKCSNIFNTTDIVQMVASHNVVAMDRYEIRPRQFLITVNIPMSAIKQLTQPNSKE